jgi:hypothetical protein
MFSIRKVVEDTLNSSPMRDRGISKKLRELVVSKGNIWAGALSKFSYLGFL